MGQPLLYRRMAISRLSPYRSQFKLSAPSPSAEGTLAGSKPLQRAWCPCPAYPYSTSVSRITHCIRGPDGPLMLATPWALPLFALSQRGPGNLF